MRADHPGNVGPNCPVAVAGAVLAHPAGVDGRVDVQEAHAWLHASVPQVARHGLHLLANRHALIDAVLLGRSSDARIAMVLLRKATKSYGTSIDLRLGGSLRNGPRIERALSPPAFCMISQSETLKGAA